MQQLQKELGEKLKKPRKLGEVLNLESDEFANSCFKLSRLTFGLANQNMFVLATF